MEISNGCTSQDFLNKLNVNKIKKWRENVSCIKTITAKAKETFTATFPSLYISIYCLVYMQDHLKQ